MQPLASQHLGVKGSFDYLSPTEAPLPHAKASPTPMLAKHPAAKLPRKRLRPRCSYQTFAGSGAIRKWRLKYLRSSAPTLRSRRVAATLTR